MGPENSLWSRLQRTSGRAASTSGPPPPPPPAAGLAVTVGDAARLPARLAARLAARLPARDAAREGFRELLRVAVGRRGKAREGEEKSTFQKVFLIPPKVPKDFFAFFV